MGQLSKSDAESKVRSYISQLESISSTFRKNFEDMDFENANRRDEMETQIESIESKCATLIQTLESMTFSSGE